MKRVSFGSKTTTSLTISAPAQAGDFCFTVLLVSDCYMGLDFQHDVHVTVQ